MSSRREIYRLLYDAALERYNDDCEARSIAELIITECGGITRNDLVVEPLAPLHIDNLDAIVADLGAWRPVQYIIGHTTFDDMMLDVSEGVLVPRPETEELVRRVAEETPDNAAILDVGTGSGCIAIALARRVAGSRVWALDKSPAALMQARRNAERYAPEVQFIEGDALADFSKAVPAKLDVIVSNPPYIPMSDRAMMRPNVTLHEPFEALFVPDDDPLMFYRSIARNGRKMLTEGGKLYFEIYETLADDMSAMLRAEGYADITLRRDFLDKPRMICATMSSTAR